MRLIDANELKEKLGNADGFGVIGRCIDEISTVAEIPDNATNGDMIKAMFPICCSNMGNIDNGIVVDFMGDLHTFNKDWWNAPYKRESGGNE